MNDLATRMGIRPGNVVAVIGAGGKHTLMLHLGRQLAAAGQPVLLTSTTNLHRSADYARLSMLLAGDDPNWQHKLQSLATDRSPAVVVQSPVSSNLYKGLDALGIDQLTAAVPDAVLLVKADGARKRLLKAPGEHEPVFPSRVDVCVLVLSLAAIGKTITPEHVHRIECVRAVTDAVESEGNNNDINHAITTQTIIDVITKPGGYAACLLPQSRNVLYLSSCDTSQRHAFADEIFAKTAAFFHTQIAGDTITSTFHRPNPNPTRA